MDKDGIAVIDTKILNVFFLHGLAEKGGVVRFGKYPFGVEFVGDGRGNVEARLFVTTKPVAFDTHLNRTMKKDKKEEVKEFEMEEGEAIEM